MKTDQPMTTKKVVAICLLMMLAGVVVLAVCVKIDGWLRDVIHTGVRDGVRDVLSHIQIGGGS